MLYLDFDDLKACMEAGDGRVLSQRIQDAIERIARAGGGCLELGCGEWVCATLFLRSHVELRHNDTRYLLSAASKYMHA